MTFVASGLCRRNAEPNFGFIPQPAHGFGVLKILYTSWWCCVHKRKGCSEVDEPQVLLLKLQ